MCIHVCKHVCLSMCVCMWHAVCQASDQDSAQQIIQCVTKSGLKGRIMEMMGSGEQGNLVTARQVLLAKPSSPGAMRITFYPLEPPLLWLDISH